MERRERKSFGGNAFTKIACCPCQSFASLRPGDKFLCLVCGFLLALNIPSLVMKDHSYRGKDGLVKMHGTIKKKLGDVNITASWDSLPSLPSFGGGGGATQNLRGNDTDDESLVAATPLPTASPTLAPTATQLEDPNAVAEQIASQELKGYHVVKWDIQKFPRPDQCSADVIEKVRSSGMDGSGCEGNAWDQKCSFSMLTKSNEATWLHGFFEEINELRSGEAAKDDGDAPTFVGAVLGGKCDSLPQELRAEGQEEEAMERSLVRPKLFCSDPVSNDVTKKWGMVSDAAEMSNLDKHLKDAGVHESIQDAVVVTGGEATVKAVAGGMVTLARTRYVEFDYDWRGAWSEASLQSIVEGLDKIGHTCYWAGEDKLWRITACWQDFYSYRSWSHLACSNRNLAPKLAGRMEGMFKKTIGME